MRVRRRVRERVTVELVVQPSRRVLAVMEELAAACPLPFVDDTRAEVLLTIAAEGHGGREQHEPGDGMLRAGPAPAALRRATRRSRRGWTRSVPRARAGPAPAPCRLRPACALPSASRSLERSDRAPRTGSRARRTGQQRTAPCWTAPRMQTRGGRRRGISPGSSQKSEFGSRESGVTAFRLRQGYGVASRRSAFA